MGREHGAHQRVREPLRDGLAADARRGEAFQRRDQAAALRRRAGQRVRAAAAILVSFVATIYPARNATKISPAEVLRYE